jgi:hypothetical protein
VDQVSEGKVHGRHDSCGRCVGRHEADKDACGVVLCKGDSVQFGAWGSLRRVEKGWLVGGCGRDSVNTVGNDGDKTDSQSRVASVTVDVRGEDTCRTQSCVGVKNKGANRTSSNVEQDSVLSQYCNICRRRVDG